MSEMRCEAPKTLEAAVALLSGASGVARVLAGGTDLLIQMRGGRVEPELLVDIKGIAELRTITAEGGGFRLGAAVTAMEMHEHAAFSKAWPGLTEAAMLIGSYQIKGRATVGGNLCNASPAADSVPALIAAGATATIVGPKGRRDVKVEDIATGPGKNSLAKGEIIASFLLPARPANSGDAYLRFIPRTEMDIAVVGCAISLTLDGDKIATARVALGAVAPKVILVAEAAAALIGTTLDDKALAALQAAATAAAQPITDRRGTIEFRKDVVAVPAARTARIAYARAKGAVK